MKSLKVTRISCHKSQKTKKKSKNKKKKNPQFGSQRKFCIKAPIASLFDVFSFFKFIPGSEYRSSHLEVFLEKSVLKVCSKFTEEDPSRSVICQVAKNVKFQSNFIEIALRVFSCKFAAYFQNTFFWEHLWAATSRNITGYYENTSQNLIFKNCVKKLHLTNTPNTPPVV